MPIRQRLMLGMFQKNLSPIGTKFLLYFLALRIILVEKDGKVYYLACALQLLLYLFCVCFALFKAYLLIRNLI